MKNIQLSIITCSYNSKNLVGLFIKKINNILKKLKINNYEIIIVDDFSKDNTQYYLNKISKTNPRIKIINLNKNLLLHKSMLIGINSASGKYIYCTDIDLEVSENYLQTFYQKIFKEKKDIIIGYYKNITRKSFLSYLTKAFLILYFKTILRNNDLIYKSSTMIMTNNFGKLLYKTKSNNFTLSTLTENLGSSGKISISRKNSGSTSYNITKRFLDAYEVISKTSNNFSVIVIFLTIISLIVTSFYTLNTIYNKLTGIVSSGFTGIITVTSIFGSLILIVLTFNMIMLIKLKNEIENNYNLENFINEKINFKNKTRK